MIIDKDSLIVNGLNLSPFIVEAKFGYHKIWGKDTGRNMAGTWGGTLTGIYPKITIQLRKLTKSEVEAIVPILDVANQSVSYYDPNKKRKTTMTTYTNDYEITCKNIVDEATKAEGFSVAFISTKRRA